MKTSSVPSYALPLSLLLLAGGLLAAPDLAEARPANTQAQVPRFYDLTQPGDPVSVGPSGVLGTSAQDTIYFGGTFWNADSARWEALQNSAWTFDSGTGSHFDHSDPHVNPFKDPSLHAYMEGWVGVDRTYQDLPYFRRLQSCAISGNYSFWAGVLPAEADELCYASGQGYGNDWFICIEQTFAYNGSGNVTFGYYFTNDTEDGLDWTRAIVDTSAQGDTVTVAFHTAAVSGIEDLTLVPGTSLPTSAGDIVIKFCVETDGAYSDEDGGYTTSCGAFAVDNISISGGGISHFTDFESGADGWALSPAPPGEGEWTNTVHINDLPTPLVGCQCDFEDSVLVLEDLTAGGHGWSQNNIAASPWVDLLAAGLDGTPGKFLESSLYAYLPVLNYTYAQVLVQYYPKVCPATGKLVTSGWEVCVGQAYFGGQPVCTAEGQEPYRCELSGVVDPGAEQIRVGIGVFSSCANHTNCTGLSNSSPWFDNLRFGVYGAGSNTPALAAPETGLPQDAFPVDGTLTIDSAGRVDSGVIKGSSQPAPGTSLGDTLVVQSPGGPSLVYVQFAVRPGPGVDPTELSNFLSTVQFEETKYGLNWYSAQMDTAEQGGVVAPGQWMTAFHEDDPGFSGSDTDRDSNDLDPQGGVTRLANDIFPDDLFTPGTRLDLFYKARYTTESEWCTLPDTTGGRCYEMEVLPSSFDSDGSFNCILYVDHFDGRPGQKAIETALSTVVPGLSPNYEQTAWDRYDVRAPSSRQATLGRPANTEYGAVVQQLLGYKVILWDSGNLNSFNLVREDANVLIPWLSDPKRPRNLYLSGDDIAESITAESEGSPVNLLENLVGVTLSCGTYRDMDCPLGSAEDNTYCPDLNPVPGALASARPLGGAHQGRGNSCPQNRSFDVLTPSLFAASGNPTPEERYLTPLKTARYASISNVDDTSFKFKTIMDGIAVHYRRDAGSCNYTTSSPPQAIEERLTEVLSYFGFTGTLPACFEPSGAVGVGDDRETFPTALANFSPNPLVGGASGQIKFTLAREGPARVDIFDLAGRLVRTVYDGVAAQGETRVSWNGTDGVGRSVGSGVYFYRLQADNQEFSRKFVVVRNTR